MEKGKKTCGRKPLNDERKRVQSRPVSMRKSEWEKVENMAEKIGVNRSAYVRMCIEQFAGVE